ncbi:MAG TPA: TonB-dependent receptor [Steroidobacteraceae bacterium]|nr:TonB-dependent receptor [Steroidobacteraceae bacterium]
MLSLLGLLVMMAIATSPKIARADVGADTELQEVVVTAQRQSERSKDVPIALTAISEDEMHDRGIRQAADITSLVPNLLLNLPWGPEAQPAFVLRGVTTTDYSQNQSSPIAMYVDEVYKAVGAVQALQVYDMDRIEVLRGPQGTLYGKNATGGAISFYSANPSLAKTQGYVEVGYGNYDDRSVRAALGVPLVDNFLAARVALYYEDRTGWTQSIVPGVQPLNGVDALAGRLTILAQPLEDLRMTLKVSATRSNGTPYGPHALNNEPSVTGFSGNIPWFDTGSKFSIPKQIRSDSASFKLEAGLAEHVLLTSISGFDYGRWNTVSDDGGLPITARLDDPNSYFSSVNTFSQELRLASRGTDLLKWLAGFYYGRESVHAIVQYHFFDGYPGSFVTPSGQGLYGFDEYNNFDQLKDSRAAFMNLTFAITPTVSLQAGVRYTKDKIEISNFYALEGGLTGPSAGYGPIDGTTLWTQTIPYVTGVSYSQYSSFFQPPGGVNRPLGYDNNNTSGKIGIDWKPSDQALIYADFSQGYRGAAFNGQAFNAPAELTFAQPERLDAYEAGTKLELWQRRASLDVAVFHYNYRNQQFLDTFALPGGLGTGLRTVNAPKSRVDGAELEVRAKVTEDIELSGSLGLLNAKYQELTLHGVDLSGNQLIQAPDVNTSLGLDWRFLKLDTGDLRLALNGNWYSRQFFDAQNTQRVSQGAYAIANGRLSFTGGRGATSGLDVGVWVKNLADRQYLQYAIAQRDPSEGGLGFDYGLVGEPRTYGADIRYRF